MRIWHKDLVPWLPRKQLLGQWQEIHLMARNIALIGTPNHILVNRMMNYPISHFYNFTLMVVEEFGYRGYRITQNSWNDYMHYIHMIDPDHYDDPCTDEELYSGWHDEHYLKQCLSNLEEKYDCGGMTKEEYYKLIDPFAEILY